MNTLTFQEFNLLSEREQFDYVWEQEQAELIARVNPRFGDTNQKPYVADSESYYPHSVSSQYEGFGGCGSLQTHSIPDNILEQAVEWDACVGVEGLALKKVGGNIVRGSRYYEPIQDHFTSILEWKKFNFS